MVESGLKAALREILCASLSLDDGLSTIQNLAIGTEGDASLYFDVARVIEEIILRRPSLAGAKLTELNVRLAFDKDHVLRKMLTLLDARYNTVHTRAECELLPDIEAIPQLLDILGELIQSMSDAIQLNLRPLLPFLTDEVLGTLEAIYTRGHAASTELSIHEAHYLTTLLAEAGAFDCAEGILNRLITLCRAEKMDDLAFEVALDESSVLTEIGLYKESRSILTELRDNRDVRDEPIRYASVMLQLAINETRDDSVPHEVARVFSDEAAERFELILDSSDGPKDGLGLAHLVIGSNILANGWREAVPEGISRLEQAFSIFDAIEEADLSQQLLLFKCLTGLGFGYGLMRDHDSVSRSIDYLDQAQRFLGTIDSQIDCEQDLARTYNAIGWVSLGTESDEYWSLGRDSFKEAISRRESLVGQGIGTELDLLGSKVGYALSLLRTPSADRATALSLLQDSLSQYVPLFPTDSRAFIEIAIATYNLIWLSIRHGIDLPQRILRFLEDIDRMLTDARTTEDSIFIQGASLIIPYLNNSWNNLRKRAAVVIRENTTLSVPASLVHTLAQSKRNLELLTMGTGVVVDAVADESVRSIDPLAYQYWAGQTCLAKTIRDYYENKDYSELATGLYKSSLELAAVESVKSKFEESSEFINATALSLSKSLMKFALVLEEQYGAHIDRSQSGRGSSTVDSTQYDYLLSEDWLGLLKISDSYLSMLDSSELIQTQPYLNAVFSNTARALQMMDSVSLIDRRVLAVLGDTMNKRYYLRR
jgi:hypothetical protein